MTVASSAKEDDILRLIAAVTVWSALTETAMETRTDFLSTTLMLRAVETLTRTPMQSKILDGMRKDMREAMRDLEWQQPPTDELEKVGEGIAVIGALYIAETVSAAMKLYGNRANAIGKRMDEAQEHAVACMSAAAGRA